MRTAAHIISVIEKLVKKYDTRDPYGLCRLLGIKAYYHDMQKKLKVFYYQFRQKKMRQTFLQQSCFRKIRRFWNVYQNIHF